MRVVSWNRGFWLRVGTKQLPSVKQTPKLDSLLLPGQFCPFLQRWAWGRSLWILVLGCTKGVGETEPGRCSNYKHPVQSCASQRHGGLPPTGHSIQSPVPVGDPRAPSAAARTCVQGCGSPYQASAVTKPSSVLRPPETWNFLSALVPLQFFLLLVYVFVIPLLSL